MAGQEDTKTSPKQVPPANEEEEKIPHPTLELYRHTLLRGANAGSVITLVLGPPILFIRGVRKPMELLRRLARVSMFGAVIGMGLTAVLTYARLWDQTDEQIFDRCYRLRYNQGQVRLDKITYGSAIAGGLVGLAAVPTARGVGGLQGACVGVGLAVFAHVLTSPKSKES